MGAQKLQHQGQPPPSLHIPNFHERVQFLISHEEAEIIWEAETFQVSLKHSSWCVRVCVCVCVCVYVFPAWVCFVTYCWSTLSSPLSSLVTSLGDATLIKLLCLFVFLKAATSSWVSTMYQELLLMLIQNWTNRTPVL
jgi:hypothetical protein